MRLLRIVWGISIGAMIMTGCSSDDTTQPDTDSLVQPIPAEYQELLSDVVLVDPLDPVAILDTAQGVMVLELFEAKTPQTVKNFVSLADAGFYTDLRFHRVEPGFVVQTGDPTGTGNGGAALAEPLPLEIHPDVSHGAAGMVGMARRATDPNSATSQFYITLNPLPDLDNKYTVFGQVVKGGEIAANIVRGDKLNSVTILRLPVPASKPIDAVSSEDDADTTNE